MLQGDLPHPSTRVLTSFHDCGLGHKYLDSVVIINVNFFVVADGHISYLCKLLLADEGLVPQTRDNIHCLYRLVHWVVSFVTM